MAAAVDKQHSAAHPLRTPHTAAAGSHQQAVRGGTPAGIEQLLLAGPSTSQLAVGSVRPGCPSNSTVARSASTEALPPLHVNDLERWICRGLEVQDPGACTDSMVDLVIVSRAA